MILQWQVSRYLRIPLKKLAIDCRQTWVLIY